MQVRCTEKTKASGLCVPRPPAWNYPRQREEKKLSVDAWVSAQVTEKCWRSADVTGWFTVRVWLLSPPLRSNCLCVCVTVWGSWRNTHMHKKALTLVQYKHTQKSRTLRRFIKAKTTDWGNKYNFRFNPCYRQKYRGASRPKL